MVVEAKLQEIQEAGRSMVTANLATLVDGERGLSADYVIGRAITLQALARDTALINSDGGFSGLMGRQGAESTHKQIAEKRAADEKAARISTNQFLIMLEAQRQSLLNDLEGLQDRARDLSEQLEAVERGMSETRANINAIEDALQYRREHGKFELTSNGEALKDERLEDLLKAYEEEFGHVARDDPEAVQDALRKIRKREVEKLREQEQEHTRISEELETTHEEMDKKREELELKEAEIQTTKEQAQLAGGDLIAEGAADEDAEALIAEASDMFGSAPDMSGSFKTAALGQSVETRPENTAQEPQPGRENGPVIQPM